LPLVSIIVPTYNRAHVLPRAIDSVFAQTMGDFELIIVDDASTDTTQELIESIDDPRVRYMRHETNLYAGAARNTGLDAAKGEFIAFLDSDDAWLPHKLEQQVAGLREAGEDWVASYTGAYVNMTGAVREKTVYTARYEGDVLLDYLMCRFAIWTPTFLFRSAVLAAVGHFDTELERGEDIDFYLRVLTQGKLARLPEPAVELFIEASKGIADVSAECDKRLLEKNRELIDAQGPQAARYIRAFYEFRQSERYLIENRVREGLASFFTAVTITPMLPPKRYVAWLIKLLKAIPRPRAT